MLRTKAVPVIALLLAIVAIGTVVMLQRRASESRNSELDLQDVKLQLSNLQTAPFQADASTGGSPELGRRLMAEGRREIALKLDNLESDSAPAALDRVGVPLADNGTRLDRIYELGASGIGYHAEADQLAGEARELEAVAVSLLDEAGREYEERGATSRMSATIGACSVILLLLGAFLFYYRRSVRAALANSRMLAKTRADSLTDALTELGNRRALVNDLEAGIADIEAEEETAAGGTRQLMLALFDLDGFKQYNDTFGHPAGDALLRRLARQLADAVEGRAIAYRMGGDEFCLLARVEPDAAGQITDLGTAALTERGRGFAIGCSHGIALITSEASGADSALSLADERMYAQKAERASASRQSSDVLLRVLSERNASLGEHLSGVAALAEPTALRLGLSESEAKTIRTAAELHDVGKTGIPDAILEKPEPLDDDEMAFMRRHTLIGERILRAAPSLAPAAGLVRSHHERIDGNGYPDGLEGEDIPIGARVIFACDAFDAMVSERPYSPAKTVPDALAELRRCAGTQFDPLVVETIIALVEGDAVERPEDRPVPA